MALYFYTSLIEIHSKVPLIVILLLFKSITISGILLNLSLLEMCKSAAPMNIVKSIAMRGLSVWKKNDGCPQLFSDQTTTLT